MNQLPQPSEILGKAWINGSIAQRIGLVGSSWLVSDRLPPRAETERDAQSCLTDLCPLQIEMQEDEVLLLEPRLLRSGDPASLSRRMATQRNRKYLERTLAPREFAPSLDLSLRILEANA